MVQRAHQSFGHESYHSHIEGPNPSSGATDIIVNPDGATLQIDHLLLNGMPSQSAVFLYTVFPHQLLVIFQFRQTVLCLLTAQCVHSLGAVERRISPRQTVWSQLPVNTTVQTRISTTSGSVAFEARILMNKYKQ